MDLQFDEEDVHVNAGMFRIFAFHESRPITCYADLTVIAEIDQDALESGIKLKDKFATAKFLQPFFVKRIENDDFDGDKKSTISLRLSDIGH
jgi:hypothetical protein